MKKDSDGPSGVATIACKYCAEEISSKAKICKHCSRWQIGWRNMISFWGPIVGYVIALTSLLGFIHGGFTELGTLLKSPPTLEIKRFNAGKDFLLYNGTDGEIEISSVRVIGDLFDFMGPNCSLKVSFLVSDEPLRISATSSKIVEADIRYEAHWADETVRIFPGISPYDCEENVSREFVENCLTWTMSDVARSNPWGDLRENPTYSMGEFSVPRHSWDEIGRALIRIDYLELKTGEELMLLENLEWITAEYVVSEDCVRS